MLTNGLTSRGRRLRWSAAFLALAACVGSPTEHEALQAGGQVSSGPTEPTVPAEPTEPTVPADPTAPTAVVIGATASTLTLDWSPPAGMVPGSYRIGWDTRATAAAVKSWSASYAAPPDPFVFTNLAADSAYSLWIEAVDASGASGARATVVHSTQKSDAAPTMGRVAGVYWTGWSPSPQVDGLPAAYNLAYLFAAHRTTGGKVAWGYAQPTGIEAARARGVKVILSTGGAGSGISFSSRAVSQEFVDSVEAISISWGGTRTRPAFDGVDFNTFEAEATPNLAEYQWMGEELKRRFGAGFLITSPPAPWRATDREFVRAMLAAKAMDYAAPQYYDGPGLADPAYIVESVRSWVRDVAGGDASKIVVGFGIAPGSPNYSTTSQVRQAWEQLETEFPAIRGAFLWSHTGDQASGWEFANTVAPLIHN